MKRSINSLSKYLQHLDSLQFETVTALLIRDPHAQRLYGRLYLEYSRKTIFHEYINAQLEDVDKFQ